MDSDVQTLIKGAEKRKTAINKAFEALYRAYDAHCNIPRPIREALMGEFVRNQALLDELQDELIAEAHNAP